MIDIRYIGRKEWAIDPVAGSGVVWEGSGDVQEMTVTQARKILKHPDEWELANPDDAGRLEVQTVHQTLDEDGKPTEVDEKDLEKPIERMTRSELKVYAKLKYGRDIPANMSRAHMIDQVEEFEKTLNPVNTLVPTLDETPVVADAAPAEAPAVEPQAPEGTQA
ncbi:hypothetical protein [Burkholderia sp. Bp8990]|uniref:hypothetical protein n=1 Tax=Burkholderia sp. Bp8990 TaxID=2184552 RepID=UPI000F5B4305|nr:hypothetical protein [Burkholderia sp. Bp8990]RQS39773.1 hypothetical protein DIE01_16310 [Burkholderia sp. Bp8990]